MSTVIVLAKAPIAGRVKTRLCPPLSHAGAAALASAALTDTVHAACDSRARRVVLALDGRIDRCSADVREMCGCGSGRARRIHQRGGSLDERIAAAFADVGEPAVLIGMDTPQLTPELLNRALDALATHDAVIGPAYDGGFWLVGVNEPTRDVFRGVPMSVARTGRMQLERLWAAGLSVAVLETLADVDDIGSARAVAGMWPHTGFARELQRLETIPEDALVRP